MHCGGEGRTLDVYLDEFAAREADSGASNAATALGPAAGDLVAFVGVELADEIELIAVAGAVELNIDLMLRAAQRPIVRIAADALGFAALLADNAGAGPAAA